MWRATWSVRVRASRYRRAVAALFAAVAVAFGLSALRPATGPGVRVLAAARDLPGGVPLRAADLRAVELPASAVPDGALRAGAAGRMLAAPVRRGEPITDARLLGPRLLERYGPGTVAVPVRIADAAAVRLLRPGDRVDVLAATAGPADGLTGGEPTGGGLTGGGPWGEERPGTVGNVRVVVSGVPVVAVPRESGGAGEQGALVVLATDRGRAVALAGAGDRLSVAIASPLG